MSKKTTYWYIPYLSKSGGYGVLRMREEGKFSLESAYSFGDSRPNMPKEFIITNWKEITKADFDYFGERIKHEQRR